MFQFSCMLLPLGLVAIFGVVLALVRFLFLLLPFSQTKWIFDPDSYWSLNSYSFTDWFEIFRWSLLHSTHNCLFSSRHRNEHTLYLHVHNKKFHLLLPWESKSMRVSGRSLICRRNVHRAPMITLRTLSTAKARYCMLFLPAPVIKATRATTLAARKRVVSGLSSPMISIITHYR